ncbi:MAG: HisA/HisF-related TIM barrel protein [Candidatus Altiarchaeota archaeon]|nr:HisA/HisF-related TIM barrel protein [Candidatus Altiarchaeota archaeon]
MADIGLWSGDDFIKLEKVRPVIASETFSSLNLLGLPKEFILSIDTRGGELLSGMHLNLRDFLRIIVGSERINEVILLDLDRLGVLKGPNLGLCRYVLRRLSGKTIIYGGGVRDCRDLEALAGIGVNKVLVGSALHSGLIFGDPDL